MGAKFHKGVLNRRLAAALSARNSISFCSSCSAGFNDPSIYIMARIAGKKAKGLGKRDRPVYPGGTEMLAARGSPIQKLI
jgi:hypothetical protein